MYYPYVTFCVVGHFRNLNLQVLCFWAILQYRAWLIYLVKFAELSKIIHKCISILVLEALLTNIVLYSQVRKCIIFKSLYKTDRMPHFLQFDIQLIFLHTYFGICYTTKCEIHSNQNKINCMHNTSCRAITKNLILQKFKNK